MSARNARLLLALVLALFPAAGRAAVDDGSWVEEGLAGPAPDGVAAVPVVRGEAATAVLAAIVPLAPGREVAAGFVLDDVQLGRFIRLVMTRHGERVEAAIYPAAALRAPQCVAGTLGVVTQPVAASAALAAAICQALEGADEAALFARVMARSRPTAPQAAGEPARAPGRVIARLVDASHAAPLFHVIFLGLLALGVRVGVRLARATLPSRPLLGVLGAVVVAGLLRVTLPEPTTLKEAYPFRGFGVVSLPFPGLDVPAELGMPVAHHAVVNLFWLATGGLLPVEQVFFAVGWALASLTPLVLALALAAWSPSWRGPWFAAWALALLPLHQKYALSEAVTVPSAFYQSVALLALGAWARRGDRAALALLFLSLWLVFLVRPENPALAPLYTLGALALAGGPWRTRLRAAGAVLVVTLVALVPAVALALRGGPAAGTVGNLLGELPNLAARLLPPHDVWLRADLTPVYVPVAALLGASWLARRRPGGLVLLLGGVALLLPVYAAITSDVLPFGEGRYQVSLAPYWCGLAGFGLAALAEAPRTAAGRLATTGIGATALLATSLALVPLVRDASYAPQEEFRLLRAEVRPRLEAEPPICPVLLVPTSDERYKDAEGDDFVQILRKPADLAVLDRRGLRALEAGGGRPGCALFWRGLYCYRARAPGEPENPECRAILGARGVTPILERIVPNRPYHREVDPSAAERPELTFGLYRVELPLRR